MSSIISYMSLVFILTSLLALFIRKKHSIDTNFPYRPINNTHKWGNRILLILLVFSIVGVFIFSYPEIFLLFFIGFGILYHGFNAYMEFKYDREEKVYIVNLVWTVGTLVVFFVFTIFAFQIMTLEEVFHGYESFESDDLEQLEIINGAWVKEDIIYKRETTLEDKQMIDQLLSELSKIKVKHSFINQGNQENYYNLYTLNEDIYSIGIYDNNISIGSEIYKVVGENPIYKTLEESEIDWVHKK